MEMDELYKKEERKNYFDGRCDLRKEEELKEIWNWYRFRDGIRRDWRIFNDDERRLINGRDDMFNNKELKIYLWDMKRWKIWWE